MDTISRSEFRNFLSLLDGGKKTKIVITAVTDPRLKKTGNPFNNVMKISTVEGYINASYEKEVNLQRRKEGKTPDFKAQDRVYGAHENTGGSVINHLTDKIQLIRPVTKESFYITGSTMLNSELIAPFLPVISETDLGKKQGLENPVKVRDYTISNIKRVKIGARTYEIV